MVRSKIEKNRDRISGQRHAVTCESPFFDRREEIGEVRLLQAILLQAFLDLARSKHAACNEEEKFQAVSFLIAKRGEWAKSRERIAQIVGKWSAEKIRNEAIKILGSDEIREGHERSLKGFEGGIFAFTGGLDRRRKKSRMQIQAKAG
mgnify:CR=1 FL=1